MQALVPAAEVGSTWVSKAALHLCLGTKPEFVFTIKS